MNGTLARGLRQYAAATRQRTKDVKTWWNSLPRTEKDLAKLETETEILNNTKKGK